VRCGIYGHNKQLCRKILSAPVSRASDVLGHVAQWLMDGTKAEDEDGHLDMWKALHLPQVQETQATQDAP
jgi:hypothetical protein